MTHKIKWRHTTEEILDFSFCEVKDVECIMETTPRQSFESVEVEEEQSQTKKPQRSYCRALILSYNQLTDIKELPSALGSILFNPCLLAWLDLSFNQITELAPVFKTLTSLKILYLHGNKIANIDSVQHIRTLNNSLVKLTLHGNAIENIKGYRMMLINMMSNLKELDFSFVTESERKVSRFLMRPRKKGAKKPKTQD